VREREIFYFKKQQLVLYRDDGMNDNSFTSPSKLNAHELN